MCFSVVAFVRVDFRLAFFDTQEANLTWITGRLHYERTSTGGSTPMAHHVEIPSVNENLRLCVIFHVMVDCRRLANQNHLRLTMNNTIAMKQVYMKLVQLV